MAAVAELDASLQALLTLKPPGVTKGRIQSITQLCVENIKSESVIIQKIFTHFKRTPATHKLGVLYAVDSIARQWIEKAGASGQDLKAGNPTDGTYAAGVTRVSELLPTMMGDLTNQAPDDQLEKIMKLVDIWERGNTFPGTMIVDFKARLAARSTKPPSPALEKPADDTPPVQTEPATVQPLPQAASAPQPNGQQQAATSHNPLAPAPASAPAPTPGVPQEGLAALANVLPPNTLSDPSKTAHYLQVLQQLVHIGVPSEQWGDVIKALEQQQPTGGQIVPQLPATVQEPRQSTPRGRSRSPVRRGSPTYGSYRQRSPPRSFSPVHPPSQDTSTSRPKWVEIDPTLPPNHIKVLSRTLFVGGTTCPERELREVFGRFGNVQSVICQPQKRHAFVKMYTRDESLRAKTEMDITQDQNLLSRARSTKWGVGFGPRECCNYDQGVSVIPIDRLTDADRRWILSAEFGGNGGKEITHGQVMEEPDIEIGAGVSSKAISLKVGQQQQQQQQQPKNRLQHQNRRHNNRGHDHRERERDNNANARRGASAGYNPNPFPPYQPEHAMMPPPIQEPPIPIMFQPQMPFSFPPPQGGFNPFPPPGMPHFPM